MSYWCSQIHTGNGDRKFFSNEHEAIKQCVEWFIDEHYNDEEHKNFSSELFQINLRIILGLDSSVKEIDFDEIRVRLFDVIKRDKQINGKSVYFISYTNEIGQNVKFSSIKGVFKFEN